MKIPDGLFLFFDLTSSISEVCPVILYGHTSQPYKGWVFGARFARVGSVLATLAGRCPLTPASLRAFGAPGSQASSHGGNSILNESRC